MARGTVAGKHYLATMIVDGVKRVEELLLGLVFTFKKLDVVNNEDVAVAVVVFE